MHPTVARLTLEEKASLVSGASFWTTQSVEHAGVRPVTMTDGPHGVRLQLENADHLGIYDSEPATAFPTAAATGSSWDPELLAEMGRALGAECRALGVDILLGPGVNMKRSPLCGRNFEYLSEDPLLSGVLGAAWVRGLQERGVGASVKHFAANNQETDRMRVSAEVDERTLREIYLPAFERVVRESAPATVMCAYNKINGVFASRDRWLLTEVLRHQWGFDGYVVSDWGAVSDPVASVAAGLDLQMPTTQGRSPAAVAEAVRSGALAEADLDRAVSRLLTVHDRLLAGRGEAPAADLDAHHGLARRIAAESSVLLSNAGDLLPLDPATGGTVAVIGEFARTPRFQGGGSSHINPPRVDAALAAVEQATTRTVRFAPGFSLEGGDDAALHAQAVEIAREADVVVLFLGLPEAQESEGFDRTHLLLPATQLALVEQVLAVNARVVVVLSNGGVVTLEGIARRVPAILETWLGGQAWGAAVADMLFGTTEPGGRLAETIPVALAHTPARVNWPGQDGAVRYGEGVYIGYRWYDVTDREVAFPFGHGRGYTSFAYSDLRVRVPDATRARADVAVTVTNTGRRRGAEVVQVYVSDVDSSVARPVRELKGFAKVRLDPGESVTVTIELDERAFAFWGRDGWTVEPGEFVVAVGASSRDLRLREEVVLDVPAPLPPLDAESTVGEWLSHPVGGPVLQGAFAQMGDVGSALVSEEVIAMTVAMPLRSVFAFGQGVDADQAVGALLAQVRQAAPAH